MRKIGEAARNFRADKAKVTAETAKAKVIGEKIAAIKADQADAAARIEVMDAEMLGDEVDDAFDRIQQSPTEVGGFMKPDVGASVGDALRAFEGKESLRRATKEDAEDAVDSSLVEMSVGEDLSAQVEALKAKEKEKIDDVLERISGIKS